MLELGYLFAWDEKIRVRILSMVTKFYFLQLFVMLLLTSCRSSFINEDLKINSKYLNTTLFDAFDTSDTLYIDDCFRSKIKDTFTSSGYFIKYWVFEETKYRDLYYTISKDSFIDTIQLSGIFEIEDCDFVPIYYQENDHYILMQNECAAIECDELTFIDKLHSNTSFSLDNIIYENLEFGVFVSSYLRYNLPSKDFSVFDLNNKQTIQYSFDTGILLDTVYFKGNQIFILGFDDSSSLKTGVITLNR